MQVIALLAIVAVAAAASPSWEEFKATYNKKYASDTEEYFRSHIYNTNVEFIENHNAGRHSYTLAVNEFADLLHSEFRKLYLAPKFDVTTIARNNSIYKAPVTALPTSVDWRQKGVVTPIKNQGQCGSCWSFSTTGSVEGAHAISTGSLVSLSEQNLMDCSTAEGNQGCNGGLMDQAFEYIIKNNGIDTESSYPYQAVQGKCRYNSANSGATISSYTDITKDSESDLQTASATVGPISVAIDAGLNSFQFYSGGVYNPAGCSSTQLDHGVLVVGYGVDGSQDYWLVKNSWGTSWGLQGYIMMARNANNKCGIASMASYPVV